MRILAGLEEPDEGVCSWRKQIRLAYVPQEPDFPRGATVQSVLDQAAAATPGDEEERTALVNVTLGRAGFASGTAEAAALSGGWRKRLALAEALVRMPDVLLLDEPTNHLDLEGIQWLEQLLAAAPFASIAVSHDRYFLENVATRMAEIDRAYPQGIFAVDGNYLRFLERKQEYLAAQAKRQEALEGMVRRELEWLRRGPKARTTKAKARIDSAGRLMDELADVTARQRTATTRIDFTATDRKTKKLITAEGISKSMGGRLLFEKLNLTVSAGARVGLVGANGTGKSTLLKLLLGELEPDSGAIERAELLRMVYFDQNREQLDPNATLRRALAPEGDQVLYRGRPQHVIGWARRFLFDEEALGLPVSALSGGERARVLLARLMLREADVLFLDEPTNDLDIPTLEVLEESLLDFPGAVVLVTHDRYLLDRISTQVLAIEGNGSTGWYADYSQWERDRASRASGTAKSPPAQATSASDGLQRKTGPPPARRKLSYLEQREFDQMEERILALETNLQTLEESLQQPDVVADGRLLAERYQQLEAMRVEVEKLYARWAELEARQG
jgi:ATP-binding cassette subfamily F protein uup